MKNTLMELVDTCKMEPAPEKNIDVQPLISKADELKMLGLETIANEILEKARKEERPKLVAGFIKITADDIEKYLDRKVAEYNKRRDIIKPKLADGIAAQWTAQEIRQINSEFGRYTLCIDPALSGMAQRAAMQIEAMEMQKLQEWYREAKQRLHVNSMYASMEQLRREIARLDSVFIEKERRIINGLREYIPQLTANPHTQSAMSPLNLNGRFAKHTCDYYSSEEGTIGKFVWNETKVQDYKGIPPQKVLQRLKEIINLKIFDFFTIGSVESIKDPLLLGRFTDDTNNRYFCDQWGEDVKIEELM